MAHVSPRESGSAGGSVRAEIRRERTPVLCEKTAGGFAYALGEPALHLFRPRVPRFFGHALAVLQPACPLEMIGDQGPEYPAEVARAGLGVDEEGFGGQEPHARLLEDVLGAAVGDTLPDVSEESRTERPEFEHEFWFGQTGI